MTLPLRNIGGRARSGWGYRLADVERFNEQAIDTTIVCSFTVSIDTVSESALLIREDTQHCSKADDIPTVTIPDHTIPVAAPQAQRVPCEQALFRRLCLEGPGPGPHKGLIDKAPSVNNTIAQQEPCESSQVSRCRRELPCRPQEYRLCRNSRAVIDMPPGQHRVRTFALLPREPERTIVHRKRCQHVLVQVHFVPDHRRPTQ